MTNQNLLNKDKIFRILTMHDKTPHVFVSEGNLAIRRALDDKLGASLAFNINHFATGYYGSFEKKRRKK